MNTISVLIFIYGFEVKYKSMNGALAQPFALIEENDQFIRFSYVSIAKRMNLVELKHTLAKVIRFSYVFSLL